jgi:hypothetical protein
VDISAAVTKPADELRVGLGLTFLQSIPKGPNGKSLGSGLRDQSYLSVRKHTQDRAVTVTVKVHAHNWRVVGPLVSDAPHAAKSTQPIIVEVVPARQRSSLDTPGTRHARY